MNSTEFLGEGVDRTVADVKQNHPEIYAFFEKMGAWMTFDRNTRKVDSYDTDHSHMVQIVMGPTASMENTRLNLEAEGISYESITDPINGGQVLSGNIGEMYWSVKDDDRPGNITETWLFTFPRTVEEAVYEDEPVDEGEPTREKVDINDVFGSDAANVLRQEGIKFYEKPSYWSDLERKAIDDGALMHAEFALKDEGIELPEYAAWEIFPINPDGGGFVKGPLSSVENMPDAKVFVIYDLPYSDERRITSEPQIGRFLVDTQGAQTYIRSWIMIK